MSYANYRLPPAPSRPPPPQAKPKVTYRGCVVCKTADEERFMEFSKCCEAWMHKHKHPLLRGGCFWELCPKVINWNEYMAAFAAKKAGLAAGTGAASSAHATAAKAGTVAAGVGVKPGDANFKMAAASQGAANATEGVLKSAASGGAAPAAVKDEAPKTQSVGADQIKKYAFDDLGKALQPILEKGSDLLPLLATYEMVIVAFNEEKGLLAFLNSQKWDGDKKANLQKAFDAIKDTSKLNEAQLFAYNQVKEFLNPGVPYAYAYVYVRNVHAKPKVAESDAPKVVVATPEDDAADEAELKKAAAEFLPKSLTFEEGKRLLAEIFQEFAEDKIDFKQLKIKYFGLSGFVAAQGKLIQPPIDVSVIPANIMIVQSPQFFEKLQIAFDSIKGRDIGLSMIRVQYTRIACHKLNLEAKFLAFKGKPSEKTFDELAALSKKYEAFDAIAFLKDKFVFKEEATIDALAKFFTELPLTSARQAWINALKPVVDAAKKESDDKEHARAHRVSLAVRY